MTGYTLRWKSQPVGPVDGSMLRPDLLGSLDFTAVAATKILVGRRTHRLDEIFTIEGDPGSTLTVEGSPHFHDLGQGMVSGQLLVQGHGGDYCGRQMAGGNLTVEGSTGDYLGAGMSGGLLRVHGSAGNHVGGPPPIATQGMTGGEILIHGAAGERLGFRMRRGLIATLSAGPYAGNAMLAGTLLVVQGALLHPGLELRRGSIISLERSQATALEPHFRFDFRTRPVILKILLGRLLELGYPLPAGCRHGLYALYTGDRLSLNRGEFWQWQES
jgi:formylmethanofuran dehydrogenase subunit C